MAVDYLLQENGDQIALESGSGFLILERSADQGVQIAGQEHSVPLMDLRGWKDQQFQKQVMCFIDVSGQIKCKTTMVLTSPILRRILESMTSKISATIQTTLKGKLWRESMNDYRGKIHRAEFLDTWFTGVKSTDKKEMTFDKMNENIKEKARQAKKRTSLKSLWEMYRDAFDV